MCVSSYSIIVSIECLFLELVMSCLPRLTTNVCYGFTLLLDMSKSFAFSNSKGGHLGSKGGVLLAGG